MNDKQKGFLIGTTVVGIITVSGIGFSYYTKENRELKEFNRNLTVKVEELQNNQIDVIDVYYEQIEEINKHKVSLSVFESDYSNFAITLKEDKAVNPLESTARLKWRYEVDLDVLGMKRTKKNDYIEFTIDKSLIKISNVIIDTPQAKSDINFFNQFKGKRIEEINNKSIRSACDSIKILANKDFEKRYNSVVKNIAAKLSYLYGIEPQYIKVNIEED